MEDGKSVDVPVLHEENGLLLHHMIRRGKCVEDAYTVTHKASGKVVKTHMKSRVSALRLIAILCNSGVDWTRSESDLRADGSLGDIGRHIDSVAFHCNFRVSKNKSRLYGDIPDMQLLVLQTQYPNLFPEVGA
jgi:hypothetical protein